ncbi:MAG: hypothetical protein WCC78_11790, partial [Terriglobales bacterium]
AGNRFGKCAISGGCKRDASAASSLLLKKLKNLRSIGKTRGVELEPGRELVFERGSSQKQPVG